MSARSLHPAAHAGTAPRGGQPAGPRPQARTRTCALACALVCTLLAPAAHADGMPDSTPAPARTRGSAARAPAAPPPASPATSPNATGSRSAATGLDSPLALDLRQASVSAALRLISETAQVNIVATPTAANREVTLYMARTTGRAALDAVTRTAGLWMRWRPASQSYMVMTAEEYQRDLALFSDERTEVLRLRHHNVISTAHVLRAMYGNRVRLQLPVEESLGEAMRTTELRRTTGAATSAGTTGTPNRTTTATAEGATRDTRGGTTSRTAGTGGSATAGATDTGPQQLAALAAAAGGGHANQLEAALQGQDAPLYVTYNRQHNLLVLRTADERLLEQARQLITQLDLPVRQVLLEMRIIEVRLNDEFHRAFDMDLFSASPASGVATTATNQALNPLTGATSVRDANGNLLAPKVIGALGMSELFDQNSSLFQLISNRVRLRLQLLEEKGRVQTLARPLLLSSNNEPARLFIGEEVVLTTGASAQTSTGTTGATNTVVTVETEQRDIGTTLVIHPRINDDRSVTLTIDQESSERVVGGTTIPLSTGSIGDGVIQYPIDTVNTASLQVVAQARDGLTIAVGGMIKALKRKAGTNVPGLSRLPLLGELFKSEAQVDSQTELVLVITPHVLESADEAQRVSRQLGGTALSAASVHRPQAASAATPAPEADPPP
jgi:general secretion pathway protein D